jgi:hypothetical protein
MTRAAWDRDAAISARAACRYVVSLRRWRWRATRIDAMNDTIDDLDCTEEAALGGDISDEELEAVAADPAMRVWTRSTTSCGGPSPGPGCG